MVEAVKERKKPNRYEESDDDSEGYDDVMFYKWDFKRLDILFDEPRHG